MTENYEIRFFLGANSPVGFYSLYDGFTDSERDHLYILKGGPGCGKSTFMRSIGRAVHEAGGNVEYIHCSGDPDSLDGVYFPALNIGYVDGTSPHVIEPRFAGASESYVNIGAFYDLAALEARREEIMRLTRGYKAYYSRAFRLLSGAAAVSGLYGAVSEEAVLTAARRARGIICRELKPSGKPAGRTVKRFLSAITCKGHICFFDTVPQLAERVYVLDNNLGLAHLVIEAVASAASERGWDVIRCQSYMSPDVTEHLIIPELSLAFVSQTAGRQYEGEVYRHLRLDSIPSRDELAELRLQRRGAVKLYDDLTNEAVSALARAKELHDRLEEQYIPNVDFDGIDRLTERHIEMLLA